MNGSKSISDFMTLGIEVLFEVESLTLHDAIQVIERDQTNFKIFDLTNSASEGFLREILERFGKI